MAMKEKKIKILFSYHRHNIEWIDMFAERLRPFYEKEQLSIIYDEVTESSKAFSVNQKELLSFDIIVFFISRKFISLNNFVGKEIPEMIPRFQEHGSRVIPVYLEDCSWQSIDWLREMKLWPSPQLPFSNMSNDEREKFISRFIKDELFPKMNVSEGTNVHASKTTKIGDEKGMKANVLNTQNRLEESLRAYEEIIYEDPENVVAKNGRADVLKMMNRLEESLSAYEEIIYEHPENVVAQNGRADVLKMMGRLVEALMCYEQSIGEYPEDFVAKIGKAEVLKMMNRLEESLNAYEQIIYEYPENVVAKTGRADLLMRLGRLSEVPEDERLNKDREFGGDDFRDDDWKKDFRRFLTEEKGWSEIYFANENYKTMAIDLSIRDPESKKLIAVINFKKSIDRKIESKAKASFAQFAELELGKYLVTPSSEKSNYSFTIYKYSDRGLVRIQPNDFPTYEDLRRKMETKTEAFGDEGGDEDFRNVFRDNLIAFLINEKKFPRESLNHGIVAEATDLDLTVAHPDTDDSLAVFDCKSGHYGKPSPEVSESMAKTYKSGLVGIQNPFAYIVHPSEESNEDFVIFEVEGDGTSHEISYGDFPAYNQLLFASPLSDPGRRICRNLTIFAKHEHVFSVDAPCQDYINLQIKENKRTAAQIHRLNDSDENIALVLAGYQKDFPEAKLPTYMFEGEVKQLSGYTSKSQGERNWLKGNLGHEQLKHEAGVYILRPGALVLDEIENEVGDLLELAKKNAGGKEEPEEKKVSKYGRGGIATIQMDRLSDVDLLGRDRLVRAFAGMFVHTEEVEGFTVALLGDWGEGKSTVMKLLRKSLNEKHPGRFDFATFNAWEYEHTDNIAAGLAQEVVKGLIEPLQQHFWERQILRFRFALKEYKGELWRLAIYSVVAIFITLALCLFLPNNTLKGLGLAGGIAAVLFLLFKNLPTIIEHPIAIKVETYLKLPNYGKHLGEIPIIQSHLKTLCSLRLVDKKKLLVFVDDLDRCQTDCIARVLDAIRLVMSIPNVIVMIGIDYRIAFKAMENYYEKLGDKGRDKSEIARDYLGKIIQLPVRLISSSPEEVRKYIEKRLFPDTIVTEIAEKEPSTGVTTGVDTEGIGPDREETMAESVEEEGGMTKPVETAEPKSVEEILIDTTIERDMFNDLAGRFNFTNPRQLLRLRNSYRFLKVMDSEEKYDREILMKILFWQEFLNNWPSIIRDQCEKSVTKEGSFGKIEKHEAKQIVQGVQKDILKIIEMPMYEEIERFVRIVVLPYSEEGVLDTREEIEEWRKKREEGEAEGAARRN